VNKPLIYASSYLSAARFLGLVLVIATNLIACVSYEPAQLVPSISLSPEDMRLIDDATTSNNDIDFGLVTAVNESDSLVNIEILPGVRVRGVNSGSPASSAGIQVGDVILAVDGMPINDPDLLTTLEQQTVIDTTFEFEVRRNTTVFLATVVTRTQASDIAPAELYRTDPISSRANYATALVELTDGSRLSAARIVDVLADSPLRNAGLTAGDIILAVDGKTASSAQGLINILHNDYGMGDSVALRVFRDNQIEQTSVTLWDPGRRISRISLGPLFQYRANLEPDTRNLSILDLWLFSIYDYRRSEGERSHSFLGLFNFTSDYGELTEVTD